MNNNYNIGVSYSGETAVPAMSQIEAAFNEVDSTISSLHDLLANLENRIGSVLLPQAPAADGKSAGPSPVAIESAALYTINSLKQRVADANTRVASMLNRSQV